MTQRPTPGAGAEKVALTVIPRSLLRPKAWLYAWNAPRRTDTTLGSPAEAHCADAEGAAVATREAAFEEEEEGDEVEEDEEEAEEEEDVDDGEEDRVSFCASFFTTSYPRANACSISRVSSCSATRSCSKRLHIFFRSAKRLRILIRWSMRNFIAGLLCEWRRSSSMSCSGKHCGGREGENARE